MDRSFWCLHDHLGTFALLGLPVLLTVGAFAIVLALLMRSWTFDPFMNLVVWGLVVPTISMTIVTFTPLPCGVFAWSLAIGEPKSPGDCLRWCLHSGWRLASLCIRLTLAYALWFLFLGLPMLVFWPRTCLAPFVVLFEKQAHVFRRSRKLMYEDQAMHVMAGLYLLLGVCGGVLFVLPRAIISTRMFQVEWLQALQQHLWAFELVCGAVFVSGMAVSWCVSLALFYHGLRHDREGDWLRTKLERLSSKYLPAQETAS